MKKAALITLGILVAGTSSWAQFLDVDTKSVAVDYVFDDDAGSKDAHGVEVGFGAALYELDDVAVLFAHVENSIMERQYLALRFEQNWPVTQLGGLVPFAGVSLGYGWLDVDGISPQTDYDTGSFAARIEAGAKIMFSDSWALSASARYNWASKNIYLHNTDDDFEETNWDFALGLRFYY